MKARTDAHTHTTWLRWATRVAAGACVALLAATPAGATSLGQVRLKYASVSPRRAANLTVDGKTTNGLLTGKYNLRLDGGFTPTGEGEAVYDAAVNGLVGTFCADVRQWAPTSYKVYDVYAPEDAPIGGGNTAMQGEKAWDLRRLFDQHTGDLGTHDGAAAFQACVWEIVYEDVANAYDVHAGALSMTYYWGSGWLDTANTWLAALGTDEPDVPLRVLANPDNQDFAMWVPGLPADPIPEPVTVAGLVLGVGSLAGYVQRRKG